MACIRWVFPKPLLPYINSGLYIAPGFSATASPIAFANLLLSPEIKLSKLYLLSKPLSNVASLLSVISVWGLSSVTSSGVTYLNLKIDPVTSINVSFIMSL